MKRVSKKVSSKPMLYNDLHPESSLQGTGFKDSVAAQKTIKLIAKRSLRYQFDVVNTMYNRAKYHPHQTDGMRDAMKVFAKFLVSNKKLREKEELKYPWLSLATIKKYIPLAEKYNVSEVARGLKKGSRTDEGFFAMYEKVAGKKEKLCYIPVHKNRPDGQDYWSYRISFIKARLGQMKAMGTPFFDKDGVPTKQHVILIMHGWGTKVPQNPSF